MRGDLLYNGSMPSKKRTKSLIFELFRIYRIQRFLFVALGVIILGAGLMPYFENQSGEGTIIDFKTSLWWAFVTASNTGYGDHVPVTFGGRVIAVILMFSGMVLLSTTIALVASYFSHRRVLRDTKRVDQKLESIEENLADLKNKMDFLVKNGSGK